MKKLSNTINIIQGLLFILITPFIILFWIAKIFGNFMVNGADSGLEIISNIHNNLFNEDSNGENRESGKSK